MPAALFRALCPLILASASPRRKSLLRGAGLDLPVVTADSLGAFSEPLPTAGQEPETYAEKTALAKTLPVAARHPEACVLGADTIVALGKDILGKPKDPDEALAMLCRLNGRAHRVITACAIAKPGAGGIAAFIHDPDPRSRENLCPRTLRKSAAAPAEERIETLVDATDVFFGQWPMSVLEAYARCGEPMDKAGAYAIQGTGGGLITGIHGSWSTVVGLPLPLLLARLLALGFIAPNT